MNHKVSVIIPVLNAADLLKRVLKSLSEQTYPGILTEIIVIDNGSSDLSLEVAKSFRVKVYTHQEKKSPYAARNLGFEHATGSIIALTDANKIPDKRWLEEGVKSLEKNNADLAGGQISFELREDATSAQLFDSITFNNNRMFVVEQQRSAAGNLFFRKGLLEKVGNFPDMFRSGMDIWWTAKAVDLGFKIVFAEKSIVYCQPRKLKSILKKSRRVGVLHPVIFQQQGKSLFYILGQIFRTFAPPKIHELKQRVNATGRPASLGNIWSIAWLSKIMMGLGRIQGLMHLSKQIDGSHKK